MVYYGSEVNINLNHIDMKLKEMKLQRIQDFKGYLAREGLTKKEVANRAGYDEMVIYGQLRDRYISEDRLAHLEWVAVKLANEKQNQ